MGVNRYLILKYNEGKTMKERFLEVTADADQNQEAQFDTWLSGKGIPFASSEAEADYKARILLIKDAPTDKRCDPA
jgi:hypothetical protein